MELLSMKNIGKTMTQKLNAIGINSAEKLIATGSHEAFAQLKARYPETCLVHLYTLYAAIEGIDLQDIPGSVREELKKYHSGLQK